MDEQHHLLIAIEEALSTWREAWNQFNYADREMIDYIIFKLNAAEKHYAALVRCARRLNLTAWPVPLKEAVGFNGDKEYWVSSKENSDEDQLSDDKD